jgi:anti-sigma factor RsiW
MTDPIGSITEADLHAYVDDQLTTERRIAVEEHLSRHPELAARIMADLRMRDALRVAMTEVPPRQVVLGLHTRDTARRLDKALARDASFLRVRRVAAIAALIAVGWFAHVEFTTMGSWTAATASVLPGYVKEAERAHRTALLRASMQSQALQPNFNRDEIRAATAVTVPELPGDWQVLDVQIFPSSAGPAVEMAIKTADLGTLSLFAVRSGRFDVLPATVAASGEVKAAYWQIGDSAYALVGNADGKALSQAAAKLATTLY